MNNKNFLIGCLAGGLAGLAVSILFAPQSGNDLINQAMDRVKSTMKRGENGEEEEDSENNGDEEEASFPEEEQFGQHLPVSDGVYHSNKENEDDFGNKKGSKKKNSSLDEHLDDSSSKGDG
ncbi:MAG: YtxH domain-containing protein [Parachlamydia sp.]|jgi:gas vesicle protein|nr:YtxH domain-containing protein [Parachlamydia sp.]